MMKQLWMMFLLTAASMLFISCNPSENASPPPVKEDLMISSGSTDTDSVQLTQVDEDIWIHTSYEDFNGSRTPSNGLLVVCPDSLVLIDTPWNDVQTQRLITLARNQFNKEITLAIITHAHKDRMGGINALLENKIDTRSTRLTAQSADELGYKSPSPTLDSEPDLMVGDRRFEVFYPGAGHSADNIVVWIPHQKILFGGCIIKAMDSKNLGATADANIEQWTVSVQKILERYPLAETVVPGHGKWGGVELVKHTLELLAQ